MSPGDVRLMAAAYEEALVRLAGFFAEFPQLPPHAIRNGIACEIAERVRRGVRSRPDLVAHAVDAVLSDTYRRVSHRRVSADGTRVVLFPARPGRGGGSRLGAGATHGRARGAVARPREEERATVPRISEPGPP